METPTNWTSSEEFYESDWDYFYKYNDSVYIYSTPVEFPLPFQILVYIVYNLVFVGALVGNILVVYVVVSSAKMRTTTNFLITNLAIGDLCATLLCVPFSYIVILLQMWPFGEFLCHIIPPAQAISVFVSAYTLVALALDRYMAILYPLKPRLRKSQAGVVIILVWIVAFLTSIPIILTQEYYTDFFTNQTFCEEKWPEDFPEADEQQLKVKVAYSLTLMILQYFIPIFVIIFTYARIALAIWGKNAPGEGPGVRDQRIARAKRKTVLMTFLVVAGYTLAWLPINIITLIFSLSPSVTETFSEELRFIYFGCHLLAMAHTMYNPLIYTFTNSSFRNSFKEILFCCRKPNSSPTTGASIMINNGHSTCTPRSYYIHHHPNNELALSNQREIELGLKHSPSLNPSPTIPGQNELYYEQNRF